MKIIKQFGLQRSGTNAIRALTQVNFQDIVFLSGFPGGKHDPTSWEIMKEKYATQDFRDYGIDDYLYLEIGKQLEKKNIYFIINVKDPLSWLNSYFRYQKKKLLVKNPNANFNFDLKFTKKALYNWSNNVISWIEFFKENQDRCIVIQHEKILQNTQPILMEIEDKFLLTRKGENLTLTIDGYMKRGTDQQHGLDLVNQKVKFDKDYHLNGNWVKDVPDDVFLYSKNFSKEFFEEHPSYLNFFDFEHLNQLGINY